MGRRRSFFSKSTQKQFSEQPPNNKIFGGVFCLILSVIGIIIGIVFSCKNIEYSFLGIYIIVFSAFGIILGTIVTLIGKFEAETYTSNSRQKSKKQYSSHLEGFENEIDGNSENHEPQKELIETEIVPDYIKEQQRILTYIEKNEGLETDDGEHYYKLAMCYLKLQKACYRPKLIENLEKYLTAKPFTAIYENYFIDECHCGFYTRPTRVNDYELAERNFLREIYYFLGRAYEQEGNGKKAIYYLDLGMGIIPEGAELFIIELFLACKKANDLPLFLKYCDQLPKSKLVEDYRSQTTDLINKGYVYKPRKK